MYVRRKPNKTGTVSVQVISKLRGGYKVLRSFCVGRTEIEITRLEETARQFIREQTGLTNELFENEDEVKIENFVSTLSNYCIMLETERMLKAYKSSISITQAQEITRNMYHTTWCYAGQKNNFEGCPNAENRKRGVLTASVRKF